MGCGSSIDAVYSYSTEDLLKIQSSPLAEPSKLLILESPERSLIKEAESRTGGSRPGGEVHLREQSREKSPTFEKGAFDLPESQFGDGRLGISDGEHISSLKASIPKGELFVDSSFPPSRETLFFTDQDDDMVEWMRPLELSGDPNLFVEGASRRDVLQGILGNCWFLSSCAAVARKPKLIERVIPPEQPLYGPDYKGLIICRFWRFGEWVSVCIDDFLPTKDGKLIYAKSGDPNEFWVALLEKAYAKLHGSYQALEGGQSMDAMVDLTGGLAERYDLDENTKKEMLFNYLSKSSRNGAFITASRKGDWRHANKTDENGLVEGHAYTITGVVKVRHKELGIVPIIRARNPWGNSAEWSGDWSDGDKMWDGVSQSQRRKVLSASVDKEDGEFWMSFLDFWTQFEEVSLCTIGPDFDTDGEVDEAGLVKAIRGEWIIGHNAGGCRNDFSCFATNPQFSLTIEHIDDEDEENVNNYLEKPARDEKTHVLIGLMQEHRQTVRSQAVKMTQIGFCVYKSNHPDGRLATPYFLYNYDEGSSGTYINYREVICRLELSPGYYVIIPATFEPYTSGRFMVRVYSPKKFTLKELA